MPTNRQTSQSREPAREPAREDRQARQGERGWVCHHFGGLRAFAPSRENHPHGGAW